jgi:hypothetical protein
LKNSSSLLKTIRFLVLSYYCKCQPSDSQKGLKKAHLRKTNSMSGKLIALVLLGCFSCIGVDKKDAVPRDPILILLAGGKLTTTDKSGVPMEKGNMGILALQVGEKQTVSIEFFNQCEK